MAEWRQCGLLARLPQGWRAKFAGHRGDGRLSPRDPKAGRLESGVEAGESGSERVPAATGAGGVGVFDLEAAAAEILDEVDHTALQIWQAERVDENLDL